MPIVSRFFARLLCAFVAAALCWTAAGTPAHAAANPANAEDSVSKALAVRLPVPELARDREYLGLEPDAEDFALAGLNTRYVVVQVFSAYCPHCQAEAPALDEVFAQLKQVDSKRLLFVALGANNTVFETTVFRGRYKVTYPVAADPSMDASFGLGAQVTPSYFVVDLQPKPAKVVYSLEGRFDGPHKFVETVLEVCKP